jgi:acetate kinase
MARALLVLNTGSSSLKFSVFLDRDTPRPLVRGQIVGLDAHSRFVVRKGELTIAEGEWPAGTPLGPAGAIEFLLSLARRGLLTRHRLGAVGHRIVHGGRRLTAPAIIDAEVLREIEALIPVAPLHQPHAVAAIKAITALAPEVPQVACFDTAFHQVQPREAQAFALPRRYATEEIRRYGFHGLSYEYVASALVHHDHRAAHGRTVVAHLGNGASLCALKGGRSTATTMGFSTLDGLVMGTRCGAIDPGVLFYLLERHGLDPGELRRVLHEDSGLLGVSGISSDMRELLKSADSRAAEAVDLFVYRIGRELGSMAAALRGLDAMVFTGGIGENAAVIRARVCHDAGWLGVELDPAANVEGGPRISRPNSPVSVWVIPTDEEAIIAAHTRRLTSKSNRREVLAVPDSLTALAATLDRRPLP